jgi:hypothetical protein
VLGARLQVYLIIRGGYRHRLLLVTQQTFSLLKSLLIEIGGGSRDDIVIGTRAIDGLPC